MKFSALKRFAALLGVSIAATSMAYAQDAKAVLDALVKKGVLTSEEAKQIAADSKAPVFGTPGSKNVSKLAITGRVQAQYNMISNDADNAVEAATNSRFSLRRVRLGATADFGKDFRGVISYDMVTRELVDAYVRWNQSPDLSIDAGFRKVNFGMEENTSSARLPAIERSPVTRFFVEENNGRRLGGGSRRVGIFADGKAGDAFYGAAITNIERQANPNSAPVAGNSQPALWLNGGFKGKSDNSSYTAGLSLGYMPEQVVNGVLTDGSLFVTSLYGNFTVGSLALNGEFLWSDNDAGAGSNSWGVIVMPTYDLSKQLQLVARFSYLDTDGIGTRASDVVPGAGNAAGNPGFETVSEIYGGINYFFKGNDVKFSAGIFHAMFDDQIGGGGNVEATATGLRTQMQINF